MTSCLTQKRCYEKFPLTGTQTVITKDSIVTCTDTVYVTYQELTFAEDSPCPEQVNYSKKVSNKGLTTSVIIKDGKISISCKADSLQALVNSQKEYITKHIRETLTPKEIPVRDGWYYFYKSGFYILLFLLLLVIAGLFLVK